jgi:hypothetical protein
VHPCSVRASSAASGGKLGNAVECVLTSVGLARPGERRRTQVFISWVGAFAASRLCSLRWLGVRLVSSPGRTVTGAQQEANQGNEGKCSIPIS